MFPINDDAKDHRYPPPRSTAAVFPESSQPPPPPTTKSEAAAVVTWFSLHGSRRQIFSPLRSVLMLHPKPPVAAASPSSCSSPAASLLDSMSRITAAVAAFRAAATAGRYVAMAAIAESHQVGG
ncbi:unnamed protein product [Lactuca virosa]|uniref:Uncharacterized protein n=1 Tax=Lactuca virosa TaxID=75947 RepID=A0AAU9LPE8_9ASTR|nr:unnamed protein product [Lactuca virosa]